MSASEEQFQTVIIGGGQAGLAAGYYLKREGQRFVILDAGERVGDSWRGRWPSLRLYSPAQLDGLPGMDFPAPPPLVADDQRVRRLPRGVRETV